MNIIMHIYFPLFFICHSTSSILIITKLRNKNESGKNYGIKCQKPLRRVRRIVAKKRKKQSGLRIKIRHFCIMRWKSDSIKREKQFMSTLCKLNEEKGKVLLPCRVSFLFSIKFSIFSKNGSWNQRKTKKRKSALRAYNGYYNLIYFHSVLWNVCVNRDTSFSSWKWKIMRSISIAVH